MYILSIFSPKVKESQGICKQILTFIFGDFSTKYYLVSSIQVEPSGKISPVELTFNPNS